MSRRRNTSKIVSAPEQQAQATIIVMADRAHPMATASPVRTRYSYEWAGFRFESVPLVPVRRRWLTGDWDVFMLIRAHGVCARRVTPVVGRAHGLASFSWLLNVRFGGKWVGCTARGADADP